MLTALTRHIARVARSPGPHVCTAVASLIELRDGPLAYSADNKRNVFNEDGTLTHVLKARTDGGSEFKRTGASFEDVVHEVTLPASELRDGLKSRLRGVHANEAFSSASQKYQCGGGHNTCWPFGGSGGLLPETPTLKDE